MIHISKSAKIYCNEDQKYSINSLKFKGYTNRYKVWISGYRDND